MKASLLKPKILLLAVFILFNLFFSNSYGVVDIEKMAIITAIGIDMEEGDYSITAQIAVPEEDSSSTEKRKTHLEGKGVTVGDAIKSISDISGWYPQLVFCNLIVVGKDFQDKNVLTVLDFFAKTLRVQDSALVVFTQDTTARELISESSPMDNISSFAIQKILHKKEGFNKDVAEINIKDFCAGYYSRTSSSYMPIIKTIKQDNSSNSGGGSGGETNNPNNAGSSGSSGSSSGSSGSSSGSSGKTPESGGNSLFDAKNTALFKNGRLVGTLNENETAMFKLLSENIVESTITVEGVSEGVYEKCNYLVTVVNNDKKLKLDADENGVTLNLKVNIFCKISDQNSEKSQTVASKNTPLPDAVKWALEEKVYSDVYSLLQKIKNTDCDLLNLDHLLFRNHYENYPKHKDGLLEKMNINLKINVSGQK